MPRLEDFARAHVDGAARGNPGPAGLGVVFEAGGRVEKYGEYLGRMTNNQAEYHALIKALEIALTRGVRRLEVFTDSQLLAKQVNEEYKVRSPVLKPLHAKVVDLTSRLEMFEIKYVGRRENAEADRLANEAIDRAMRRR
ncbi:MAG: ribonuclease HI family protein [Candidatus Caldarchaeum sp.]